MYFISIKNMKWKFGNVYVSFENIKHSNKFLNTYNKYSNNSLINRLLMVSGSWPMAQGSCLKARGSRPRKMWR